MKLSVWVPALYLVAVVVAFALALTAPEAGIWAVLLTMPWPLLSVPLIQAIDPALMDSGAGMVAAGVGAVINAVLLHMLLRRRDRAAAAFTDPSTRADEGQVTP